MKKIVIKFVDELKLSLTPKNITLNLDETVVDHLAKTGYDPKMGARPLGRKIDQLIRIPLSKRILFDRLVDCTVTARMKEDKVDFEVIATKIEPTPVVDDNGYIRIEQ